MATIPQKELRNNIGEVLRRAEAGERITITVNGRPVAELGPVPKRHWVSAEEVKAVFDSPPGDWDGLKRDLDVRTSPTFADPFPRR